MKRKLQRLNLKWTTIGKIFYDDKVHYLVEYLINSILDERDVLDRWAKICQDPAWKEAYIEACDSYNEGVHKNKRAKLD